MHTIFMCMKWRKREHYTRTLISIYWCTAPCPILDWNTRLLSTAGLNPVYIYIYMELVVINVVVLIVIVVIVIATTSSSFVADSAFGRHIAFVLYTTSISYIVKPCTLMYVMSHPRWIYTQQHRLYWHLLLSDCLAPSHVQMNVCI